MKAASRHRRIERDSAPAGRHVYSYRTAKRLKLRRSDMEPHMPRARCRRRACEINNAQERGHSCPLKYVMALTPKLAHRSSRQERIESGLITRFKKRQAQAVRQGSLSIAGKSNVER